MVLTIDNINTQFSKKFQFSNPLFDLVLTPTLLVYETFGYSLIVYLIHQALKALAHLLKTCLKLIIKAILFALADS